MHFKAQISKIITLNKREILSQNYVKQEIKRNCYFKTTFNPVKAKIITLNMKSKEIIISNQLLSQNWQQNNYFKQ